MVQPLKTVLMKRDNLTSEEADERIEDARNLLQGFLDEGNLEDAYEVCMQEFGLEPDYLMDLIGF